MAAIETIARPYAKAAFRCAVDDDALDTWLRMLEALSWVASDPAVVALLSNPKITDAQLGALFKDVLTGVLDDKGKNFVDLLSEKGRLAALDSIYAIYQTLYEEQKHTVTAKVFVAEALSDDQLSKLKSALEKRLSRAVELDTIIDPSVYGGIRVQANDLVIDGTIRGRLQRLFENLNA